ncbi:MAG TPA: hypothetical protein VNZ52_08275 [Candidatus Thermoplasmatota archaeon]|nr:hypothetical protein [Candidatus Thermoplasmatota archaeon]
MSSKLPLILVTLALVAGCLNMSGPNGPAAPVAGNATDPFAPFTPPVPDFDFGTVVDPDHGAHNVPDLHTGGHGLALVGHAGIQDLLPPGMQGSITQIDLWQNYAVVSGMDGELGFAIVDLTDPAAPKALSYFPSVADDWTARFSDDGNYVFLGCQILTGFSAYGAVKGDCENPDSVHAPGAARAGVTVVDVSDKANPKLVTFTATGGSHNLQVANINGTDYVFTSAVTILKFDRDELTLTEVAAVPGRHDATVAKHPVTGDWLLYTGTEELAIWNVNNPADPQAVFEGGVEGVVGWHEQTVIPGLIEGRYLIALAGESFAGAAGVPDEVSFVDITDPANPVPLGTWAPPFAANTKVPWVSYLYSAHEIAATPQGQVAISWYHGGVWVVDVSTLERAKAPVTLAAYLPNKLMNVQPSTFAQTPMPVVPFVWGAGWDHRGYLVIPDMHTGVYVLEPEWGLRPALDSGQ